MPSFAPAAAIRRSQLTASSSPPPRQSPLIAATVGQGWATIASIAAWNGWATSASASSSKASSVNSAMSYPAEKSGGVPVIRTQRVVIPSSSRGSVAAIAARISWSSALRRSGLAMRSRATASAGRSSSSLPPARRSDAPPPASLSGPPAERSGIADLLEHDEDVAFAHRLALRATDLAHLAVVLGLDRDLHLHRLKDDDGVALADRVADRDLDFPDVAGDVCLDVRHRRGQ